MITSLYCCVICSVIGVLGCEGVGKTYIMNLLATYPKREEHTPFPVGNGPGERSGHSTLGVSAYITSDRIILIGKRLTLFLLISHVVGSLPNQKDCNTNLSK